MKVIYVAGPYRGPNAWEIEQNIRRAEELALVVWKLGAAAICPHANTRFYQGAAPDEVWLEGDLEILRRCDGVLMCPDWRLSEGATEERNEAERQGLPIFYNFEELKAWLNPVECPVCSERFYSEPQRIAACPACNVRFCPDGNALLVNL